jgi:hypothetical protein
MASFDLTWAHVGIAGLALDVAGAVVLGWAFSTKKPEQIRTEVPETLSTVLYPGSVTLAFPQKLAESMIRNARKRDSGSYCSSRGCCCNCSTRIRSRRTRRL